MFFGVGIPLTKHTTNEDGSETVTEKSANIYNALNMILEITGDYSKALDEWMTEVQKLSTQSKSAFYKNPEKFKECVDLLKTVSKGFTTLTKCLNADISTCMKLDQGLLAAVNEYDQKDADIKAATEGMLDSEGNPRMAEPLK